ncbi:LysR substrate-binding domain-containing protein [Paenirhodobacter sp.]|uniref:LysR substrate-binding domain-containing protein n=1 Tax=Paenirhodobacter sp. TaxID=1965326 RepID=UPI003B3F87F6
MDRLPPLRLLTTFAEVARLGSMRAAAARLNVTKPAVTQALRALEDHIGVPLLDRGTRPARLTEAGEVLARATQDGLHRILSAIDTIRAAQAGPRVTLSCTLGMASYWLMPRLPAFYARHPDITVNVQAPPGDLPRIAPGIDLALRYGTGEWQDGETAKLFDEEMCPVARPDVIARLAGTPLCDAPLIHVRSMANQHWAGWAEYLSQTGQGPLRGPGQSFDNYVQATQATIGGLGVMLGWRSITGGLVADGTLKAWPGAAAPPGMAYYVTCAAPSPAAAAVRDWLIGCASNSAPA